MVYVNVSPAETSAAAVSVYMAAASTAQTGRATTDKRSVRLKRMDKNFFIFYPFLKNVVRHLLCRGIKLDPDMAPERAIRQKTYQTS